MRKFLHVLLLIPIVATLFPTTALAVPMFSGGDGSLGSPYQISTCTDLQAINSFLDKNFILINDIDCTETSSWNSGAGFLHIAGSGTPFTGKLDGDGHVIENLTINRTGSAYIGLFSYIDTGAEIYDLGLINADVAGSAYTGTLIGRMYGGTVTRVYTTGEVAGPSAAYIGGIIGNMDGGMLVDAFSHVAISSISYTGGIVGAFDSGTITNVYATGANTGGFKYGISTYFGGTISDAFYDSTTTGASDDDGNGKPRSTAQMKAVATYTLTGSAGLTTPWDFVGNPNNDGGFDDYWSIDPAINNGYPYLTNVRLAAVYAAATETPAQSSFKTAPIQTKDGSPLAIFLNNIDTKTLVTDAKTVEITTNANPATVLEYVISSNPDFLNTPRQLYKEAVTVPTAIEPRTYFIRYYSTTNVPSEVFKRTIVRAEIIAITSPVVIKPTEITPEQKPAAAQPEPITEPAASKKSLFTRDLRVGMRGEDVRALQQFLNRAGFQIATRGLGSPGNESTYFGPATRTALIKFQEANAETILRPLGLTRGSGLFLGNTRNVIAAQ